MSFKGPVISSSARSGACHYAAMKKPSGYDVRQTVATFLAGSVISGALVLNCPATWAADIALGEEVFDNNCAACHAGGNNVVQNEKTLRKAALEQYLEGGFNVDAIVHQVENGRNAMPAWLGRLSDEEIQGVAAYVYKQASEDLW